MNKIIEYRIISETESYKLAEIINKMIQKGWQPYGNLTLTNTAFHQVMVKYEEIVTEEK